MVSPPPRFFTNQNNLQSVSVSKKYVLGTNRKCYGINKICFLGTNTNWNILKVFRYQQNMFGHKYKSEHFLKCSRINKTCFLDTNTIRNTFKSVLVCSCAYILLIPEHFEKCYDLYLCPIVDTETLQFMFLPKC
jgi:hypothetical protein